MSGSKVVFADISIDKWKKMAKLSTETSQMLRRMKLVLFSTS